MCRRERSIFTKSFEIFSTMLNERHDCVSEEWMVLYTHACLEREIHIIRESMFRACAWHAAQERARDRERAGERGRCKRTV